MSALDRLHEFDQDWPTFQRCLREGKLRIEASYGNGIGLGVSEFSLPEPMIPIAQEALQSFAHTARARLVEEARHEARLTLEELGK